MYQVLVDAVASATGMHPVEVTVLGILAGYARSARRESQAVHRLLTGEDAVDNDDGLIGRVRSLEERVESLEDRLDVRESIRNRGGEPDGR